ncbi:MAG: chromophore lyase CpcT/CpeT [Synechococcales cyanobacterium]
MGQSGQRFLILSMSSPLHRLASYLAGDFSNRTQAWENPPFFAQIQVCYRPLPEAVLDGFGFYVEQAYMNHLEEPYRQAVVQCVDNDPVASPVPQAPWRLKNYRLRDPQRWLGCGRERAEDLATMTAADLEYLPGCDVYMREEGDTFVGESEPGCQCLVPRKGRLTYLHTAVTLTPTLFLSHDQGRDPETHAQVWGALAGPFRFEKITDWAESLQVG